MERLKRKKQKRSSSAIVRNSLLRITVLLVIIGLNWAGLSAVYKTFAYSNDTEDSNSNNYQAGTLDFYLSSPTSNFIPPEVVINMMSGDLVTREISVIKEEDSNSFQYTAATVETGGDDDFCNALKLEAKLEGVTKYSDGLMSFSLTPSIFIGDDGKDDWLFTVTLPLGTSFPPGKVCQMKFVFDGWQVNLPVPSSGFSDQEEIASSFATGGMKINKVYYDVDNEYGLEYANEWIEIYNPFDTPVDISGWIIEDNTSQDIIPTSDPIPAKGFAIITTSSTTWEYWHIPNGVIKIVLADGKIGNGLANGSDRVILKMPDGIEDDAMSYGTDTYAFDPPCPDVAEGHILGRVPTGLDTNTASDWKDLALPQVVVTYPTGGGWWCGQNVNLEWTATNPNGPDSDLKITLLYIRDLDKNGVVSSGDGITTIAQDIANTGSYNWKVCPCYYGYVWIKVIAVGPENFMVSNSGLSGRVFEPTAPESVSLEDLPEDCCEIELFAELIAAYEASLNNENTEGGIFGNEIPQEEISQEELITQDEVIEEVEVSGKATSTEPEENIILEESVESNNAQTTDTIGVTEELITEELITEEPTVIEEGVSSDNTEQVIEETLIAKETVTPTPSAEGGDADQVEQAPATEEQLVIVQDNTNSNSSSTPESGGDNSGSGDGGTGNSVDGDSGGEMGTIEAPISE